MVSGLRIPTLALLRLAFASAPHFLLNLAGPRNSLVHSSIGTPSTWYIYGLRLLVNIRFQVLFHSPPGVLFTFPSWYSALSVDICVLPWRVVPPASHGIPRVPRYSGSCSLLPLFTYTTLTSFGGPSHALRLRFRNANRSPQPREYFYSRFGLCRVRSPLLAVSRLISFPRPT